MNILIPYHWLLEHLKTKATPDQIRQYLSLSGPSVERIELVGNEPVFDIEVTTNRVDMMSVRGIAQEAATILPEFGIEAELIPLDVPQKAPSTKTLDLKVVNDPQLSKRILAVKLSVPTVKASPKWMQDRLIQVGQRPLNNLVDVTNYVMWELGHPTHVFDYDKLTKKTIIVRAAKKGEKITTLDHKTHTTVGGEVIFDDGTGTIIDMPGLMGTSNTVVDENTKNILFFIDSIRPEKIRFASMTHNIRTQAAILNEKHVDPHLGLIALKRGITLYQDIAKATVESAILDIFPNPLKPTSISLSQEKLDNYLGLKVEPERVARILTNLGCLVKTNKAKENTTYEVTPPSSRMQDITIYQDLIEEIARIYGYHNLPSTMLSSEIPDHPPLENFSFEYKVKTLLAGWGLQEVYTYSMVSKELAQKSGYQLNDHLKIKNPLADDWVYLRRSLMPSLADAIAQNPQKELSLFEMQNTYTPSKKPDELPTETLELAIVTNHPYTHLKGYLDALLSKLFIADYAVIPLSHKTNSFAANVGSIKIKGQEIGQIGQINSSLFGFHLDMKLLQSVAKTHPSYIPLSTTPPIIEDLTFAIANKQYLGPIIKTATSAHSLIESIQIKSTYEKTPEQSTNYTFTVTYRHPKKQLSDQDVTPVRRVLVAKLKSAYNAELIGSIQ